MPNRHLPFVFYRYIPWLLIALLAHSTNAANDRGLFYRAQRDGVDIYLLGSVHVGDDSLYPLRAAFSHAFDTAQTLAVEIDITQVDPVAVANWIAQNGVYPSGDGLSKHLQPRTWQRLSKYLKDQGIDPATVESQKPGLLVTTLSMRQLTSDGLSPQLGIDLHFLNAANTAKKPVLALETIEEQLALLAAMPNPDYSINAMLDEIANIKSLTDDLTTLWKRGDADKFEAMVLESMAGEDAESQAYVARLLQDRNRSMTERLLTQRGSSKTLMVVVGAAHLVGPEGIPALLRQKGFKVEQQ